MLESSIEQVTLVATRFDAARLLRLLDPVAVTIVGGSDSNGASLRLLDGLTRPDCAFTGPVNIVNRRRPVVRGIASVGDIAEVPGELGLLFVMVGARSALQVLDSLEGRPVDGVVMYSGGFAEAGDLEAEEALQRWSQAHGVPVIGPQSLGLLRPSTRFLGMCLSLPEDPVPGPVAVICQSGGLAGAAARTLLQRGLGLSAAVSYGNGSVVGFLDLAEALLEDAEVRVVLIHTESIPDVRRLRAIGRRAHRLGKAVVLTLAGVSDIGREAAISHTAAVATPRRLAQGVCDQAGILWADDVDDLLHCAEALVHAGLPDSMTPGIGIFAGSGGAAIAIADACAEAGVDLPPPSASIAASLRELGVTSGALNPLDGGAALLDHPDKYEQQVSAFLAEPAYGIICKVIGSSPPSPAMPAQFAQFEDFVRIVQSRGKTPFLATPVAQSTTGVHEWPGAPWGAGARSVATKLGALQSWARFRSTPRTEPWWNDDRLPPGGSARPMGEHEGILTGPLALERLPSLPVAFPDVRLLQTWAEVEALEVGEDRALFLKSESGLDHRAVAGAVAGPLRTPEQVTAGAAYLISRWGFPLSASAFVAHEDEWIIGIEWLDDFGLVCSVGRGGVGAGEGLLLYSGPLTRAECERQVAKAVGGVADPALADLMYALQGVPDALPGFRFLEFNPVVKDAGGQLVALDAKLVVAGAGEHPTGAGADE